MRPGTPGFVGERLRAAREARGLTGASLAEMLGVSRAAIAQYENARQSPSPNVLRKISDHLNVPLHHFLCPMPRGASGVIFYRSLSSATKAARRKAEQRYTWLREIVAYLRRYVRFPSVDIPASSIAEGRVSQISQREIEELASSTRRYWRISDGPIANTLLLLEKNGVVVARHELDSEKLDAFSEWNPADGTPYIILNSQKACAVRSRFDVGHELAHLILHRNVSQGTFNTQATFSLMEDQANRFSGAFLLPESSFTRDLHTVSLDSLRALKAKWRVSVGVMIKRVGQLGLISEEAERRLWLNYSRRGWRKREPLDEQLEEEQPRYLRRCVELLLEKGVVSSEELPFQLALASSDVEQLVGLPDGFFNAERTPVSLIGHEAIRVIPFPGRG
jgi:Zn-dependent peptidase ImmA (M78 family)